MRVRLTFAALLSTWLAATAPAAAHTTVAVRLTFAPPGAVAGAPTILVAQFDPPDGIDEELRNGQVRIVGNMSGHAMPPVEVTLASDGAPGRYRGQAEFSMAGPWRLWFRAEGAHGVMLGTAGIDLGTEPAPLSKVMVLVQQPAESPPAGDEPLPFPPWLVAAGALGLTALLWSAAVVRKLIVTRREQPAPSR